MPRNLAKPPVVRAATLEETRFLLSIIANNPYGLTEGVFWDSVAVHAGYGFMNSHLACETFQQIKTSLSFSVPIPKLEDATVEELDVMMAEHDAKGKALKREHELKREMRKEEEKLAVEEEGLRERKETLRKRTEGRMRGIKRERERERERNGDEDVKVKKEKLEVVRE